MGMYTRYAPVCPIQIYESMLDLNVIGDYHLPLAHDVILHPERYERVFMNGMRNTRHRDPWTVILDNSIIELGAAVDIKIIAEAARIVKANVIVLPDVLLDADATIDSCLSAIDPWTKELNKVLGSNTWNFMIVPQGKTPSEFARCAAAFANIVNVYWWGIPRNYNIHGLGSRARAIEICRTLNRHNHIHMLGFSDDIIDDILTARYSSVNGIDSAVPLRAASLGVKFDLGLKSDFPPRGEWWTHPGTGWTKLMGKNLQTVRDYVAMQG